MATLTTSIPGISFPADLDRLDIEHGQTEISVQLKVAAKPVYSVMLCSDSRGKASLYSLAEMLNTYLDGTPQRVDVVLDGTTAATTTCYPCTADVRTGAADFLRTHFLTRMGAKKITYPGAVEYLTFADEVNDYDTLISADFLDESGSFVHKDIKGRVRMEQGEKTVTFEVSVDKVAAALPGGTLSHFIASVGERWQEFYVKSERTDGEQLLFRNAFGQLETMFFPFVRSKYTTEIQSCHINGSLCNHITRRKKEYTGEAQVASVDMEFFLEDLISSPILERLSDHEQYVIKNGELNRDFDWCGNCSYKLTWTEATPLPKWHPTVQVRTFDETFDNTFY